MYMLGPSFQIGKSKRGKRHIASVADAQFTPRRGYPCQADDESEVAHWLPFWNHTIAYIHQTYGNNTQTMSSNGRALIAFLFGMVSHGASDAPWHSLDTGEGFIEVRHIMVVVVVYAANAFEHIIQYHRL